MTPVGLRTLAAAEVGILGLPFDEASSFRRGAAEGPEAIRTAMASPAGNGCAESGLDVLAAPARVDLGDVARAGTREATRSAIEAAVETAIADGGRLLCLGGDHAVAHPVVAATARRHPGLTVVQVDAHPDLYDALDGDRHSHACPFARLMESGCVRRLVQVGIRASTRHQREQAARFGVETIGRADWGRPDAWGLEGPVHLSLDLDGLDPAYAPGVAHPEPGGLTTREVLGLIWSLPGLVGADLVELNPSLDVRGLTAVVGAKLGIEILARLLEGARASVAG